MNAEGLASGFIGLLLIPLIIALTLGVFYLLGQRWGKQARLDLERLRTERQRVGSRFRQLKAVQASFSPEDPHPYGPLAKTLNAQLDGLPERVANVDAAYVALHENVHHLSKDPWRSILGAPFTWRMVRRNIQGLQEQITQTGARLSVAESTRLGIERQGWEMVQSLREIQDGQEKAAVLIGQFQAAHAYGQSLHDSIQEHARIQEMLSDLPDYFLEGEEEVVLQKADRQAIILAYQVMQEARTGQAPLLESLQTWERQQMAAIEKVGEARLNLDQAGQTLVNMPTWLDLSEIELKMDALEKVVVRLQNTLSRPGLDGLEGVCEEAGQASQTGHEIDVQLRRTRQQAEALETALAELAEGMKILSAQIAVLGTSEAYPIAWGGSSAGLTRLSQDAKSLGVGRKRRSPRQTEQDLASAGRLNAERKALSTYCSAIAQKHAELEALLESPEIEQGLMWCQSTGRLVGRLKEYDPENWPRLDAVGELPEELAQYTAELSEFAALGSDKPVPEEQVDEFLEAVRRLVGDQQGLRLRVSTIETRLGEVQVFETRAREKLEMAQKTLGQLALLVHSNPALDAVATPEINRLQEQLHRAEGELDQRTRGTVERKARLVDSQASRLEASANGWLEQLNKDTQAQVKGMTGALTRLDAIARLDEGAVKEARRLLESSHSYAGLTTGQKPHYRLEELLAEFKRRSDYGQACTAARKALDELEKPVVESYNTASQRRHAVQDSFSSLKSRTGQVASGQRRNWPPTSVRLEVEHQEMEELEAQWQALKEQPQRAIALVSQLGKLSSRYQALEEKLRQSGDQLLREQEQVETLEGELDEFRGRWQELWHGYRDNELASQEIRELLGSLDLERERIQRGYRQGEMNYQQAYQALKTLHLRVRTYPVALDDDHTVDMYGRVRKAG